MKKKLLFEVISEIASKNPENIAVNFCGNTLIYSQLEQQSDLLAHYFLSKYPMHRKGKIAIYIEPGLILPVALLAILKAGFSYVPISHFYPVERMAKILDDSSAFLLLSTRSIINKTGLDTWFHSVLALEDIDFSAPTNTGCLPTVFSNDLAYILYTSGSTGIPKGVAIEHRNLSYYLDWFNQDLWPQTQALLPLTSSLSFAAAVAQLYAPLLRGDTLHILPADSLYEPEVLFNWYQQYSNGAIYCVPTIWDELLNYIINTNNSITLPKVVFLSGEPVSCDLKEHTFQQLPGVRIFNLYGPTETTANGAFTELEKEKPVTLGKALRGSEIIIVNDDLQSVPAGQSGEICIIGEGVARGYINLESLTKQRFFNYTTENVFSRGYRTGDLGKVNSQGEIIYLGRIDRQMKINGVRIEPAEIEKVLRQFPNINKALVCLLSEKTDQPYLVAYLVSQEKHISISEIKLFLRKRLPDVMVPSHYLFIETLPKLPNGKLDINRLPLPCPVRPELGYPCVKAVSNLQQDLIDIWQEALGFRELGIHDDFFDLGGNSLQAIQVRQIIRRRLSCDINYSLFFNNATPYLLSFIIPDYINDKVADVSEDEILDGDNCLLSDEQNYFLVLDQISLDPTSYCINFYLIINGELNNSAIEWSLKRILECNSVLRSRFDLDEFSRIEENYSVEMIKILQQVYTRSLDLIDEMDIKHLLDFVDFPKVDLEQTLPISFKLLSLEKQKNILLVSVHHVVFDHDSINLFFNQFINYMRAYIAGDFHYKLGNGIQYQRYCQWQKKIKPIRYQQEQKFWVKTMEDYLLAGADASEFRTIEEVKGENHWFSISVELTLALTQFAKKQKTTLFICMLTAFNKLLKCTLRYKNSAIGIPVSNRMLYEDISLLGCFVNMVTYYDVINHHDSFRTMLLRCQQKMNTILDNQMFPYNELINEVRAKGWNEKLRFPVCFNYLSSMPERMYLDSCEYQIGYIMNKQARFELTLSVNEGKSFSLCFNYAKNVFNIDEIKELSEKYHSLLSEMIFDE
ncbi:non-ribosomal peptide synthetase [Xenorhabdus bovienii]|uniref:Non-ribosomal peptide synthase n=1 Tax=Xenorhabdus bovienii str. feltiae Moldova TaxID=1398200 RepID=A0A077NIA1_XENBV|nr:amino acid adenylation domain-containing protein [Xenorhabdus bovienii]CDH01892.1 Non-ribosomal peptide synthase [Xenorhabdus bovienii str. feltiae Moldova]